MKNVNNQEETNNETSQTKEDAIENIIKAILFITFLPFALAYFMVPNFATRKSIWKVMDIQKKAFIWGLVLLPVNIFSLKYILYFLQQKMWLTCGLLTIIFWISLIPISILIAGLSLRNVVDDISKGMLDPQEIGSVQNALHNHAFTKAFQIFKNNDYKLPMRDRNGNRVLGINAHPRDFRSRRQRKKLPDTHSSTNLLNGDYFPFVLKKGEGSHHLIIGATGSGKSHLLSRMALCALQQEYRVVVFDFKGGNEKYIYESVCQYVSEREIQTVTFPGDGTNLFAGDREEIAERLISFLPSATQGDGDHYRSRMIRAINAVVVRTSYNPPTSVDELLNRVRDGLTYAEDPLDIAMFKQKEKGVPAGEFISESLASRFEPLRKTGGRSISEGFQWSDPWDMAVLSFRNTSENEVRLGGAILKSLDGWLTSPERNINPRPILLVVDEGGVLLNYAGTPSLLNMVERARSANCGVVIATQTLESLGPDGIRLVGTGPTRWMGSSPTPEEMVKAAGTKVVMEASVQEEGGNWKGKKTARAQKAYVIDPDLIRALPTFYWSMSKGNAHLLLYVPPVDFRL